MSRSLLDEHRRIWDAKPVLRSIYGRWFDLVLGEAPVNGRVLEIGAGPGFLGAYARRTRPDLRVVPTDIVRTPWQAFTADCLSLPLRDRSIDTVVGVDVVHHLARPARFFKEASRVLGPGGRLAVVEPWVTPLSYPIYRWLHQEGCRLDLDPWDPFGLAADAEKEAFQGDAAVVWRLARTTTAAGWSDLGFHPPRLSLLNGFAYLLSLGFKRASFLPGSLAGALQSIDERMAWASAWLGMRVFAVWERSAPEVASGPGGSARVEPR